MRMMSKSSTTTEVSHVWKEAGSQCTPGEVLLLEFLEPMNMSQSRLAKDIGVPPRRINEIVLRKRRITADTALAFG